LESPAVRALHRAGPAVLRPPSPSRGSAGPPLSAASLTLRDLAISTRQFTKPYLTGGPGGEKDWKGELTAPQEVVNKAVKAVYDLGVPRDQYFGRRIVHDAGDCVRLE